MHYIGFQYPLKKRYTQLRNKVFHFAKKEIFPISNNIDKRNIFPQYLWKKLGNTGLLGITVDKKYGGLAIGYLGHVIAMEEISRASASVGLSYAAHSNLCINQINLFGSKEQKITYLPKLVSGKYIGALAMSEENYGSDIINMKLNADYQNDMFIINGHKMWITNGPQANIIIVYAKTILNNKQGITAFIIEKNFRGFYREKKLEKLGMRGSDTCKLIFKDCIVPKKNVLGKFNEGYKILVHGLNYERVILAAGPIGIMQACMDIVLPYIKNRKQFSKPIGEFQLIQQKLANIYTALSSSRSYLYSVASLCDKHDINKMDAAGVILYTSEHATKIALDAIQILGGNGYIDKYPTGRLLRDAKLYEIGAGTTEIRRILIGKSLFKEHYKHK